jgi:hypothetical protein
LLIKKTVRRTQKQEIVKAVEDVMSERGSCEALMGEHVSRAMSAIRTSEGYMGLLKGEAQKFVEKVSAMIESDLERTKREGKDEILRAVEDAVRRETHKNTYHDWKGRSGVTEGRVAGVQREGLGNRVEPRSLRSGRGTEVSRG